MKKDTKEQAWVQETSSKLKQTSLLNLLPPKSSNKKGRRNRSDSERQISRDGSETVKKPIAQRMSQRRAEAQRSKQDALKKQQSSSSSELSVQIKPEKKLPACRENDSVEDVGQFQDSQNIVEEPVFRLNELVWGKVRGHAWWPCRVGKIENEILPRMKTSVYTYRVHFLEDDSHSKLIGKHVMKFYENFHRLAFTNKTKKRATKAISKACKVYMRQFRSNDQSFYGKNNEAFDMEAEVRQKFEKLYAEKIALRKTYRSLGGFGPGRRKKGKVRGKNLVQGKSRPSVKEQNDQDELKEDSPFFMFEQMTRANCDQLLDQFFDFRGWDIDSKLPSLNSSEDEVSEMQEEEEEEECEQQSEEPVIVPVSSEEEEDEFENVSSSSSSKSIFSVEHPLTSNVHESAVFSSSSRSDRKPISDSLSQSSDSLPATIDKNAKKIVLQPPVEELPVEEKMVEVPVVLEPMPVSKIVGQKRQRPNNQPVEAAMQAELPNAVKRYKKSLAAEKTSISPENLTDEQQDFLQKLRQALSNKAIQTEPVTILDKTEHDQFKKQQQDQNNINPENQLESEKDLNRIREQMAKLDQYQSDNQFGWKANGIEPAQKAEDFEFLKQVHIMQQQTTKVKKVCHDIYTTVDSIQTSFNDDVDVKANVAFTKFYPQLKNCLRQIKNTEFSMQSLLNSQAGRTLKYLVDFCRALIEFQSCSSAKKIGRMTEEILTNWRMKINNQIFDDYSDYKLTLQEYLMYSWPEKFNEQAMQKQLLKQQTNTLNRMFLLQMGQQQQQQQHQQSQFGAREVYQHQPQQQAAAVYQGPGMIQMPPMAQQPIQVTQQFYQTTNNNGTVNTDSKCQVPQNRQMVNQVAPIQPYNLANNESVLYRPEAHIFAQRPPFPPMQTQQAEQKDDPQVKSYITGAQEKENPHANAFHSSSYSNNSSAFTAGQAIAQNATREQQQIIQNGGVPFQPLMRGAQGGSDLKSSLHDVLRTIRKSTQGQCAPTETCPQHAEKKEDEVQESQVE